MEISRPRPSILSLFDPLSLTQELDRATSDKENDLIDTYNLFYPSGTHKHIHAPPRTLERRLVDVGDTTVENPDVRALLSDELEQELRYIVNDADDENNTLTFRDMAKAATPKWSSCNATGLETLKPSSLPRTPLAEISFKDELTPLARKKTYKRQPVSTTAKGSQSACLIFSPFISSYNSPSYPPSYAEVPEVRLNDEPVPRSSSIPAGSLGDSSESLSSNTSNQSAIIDMLVARSSIPVAILPSSLVAPREQTRTRHLSPTSSTGNANRHSVDLQTSFQIHFPSNDTTFDLLKDKISFFGSRNEFDSFLNNLEGDSSLDDISTLGPGSKIESEVELSSMIISSQAHSVVKPTPVSKHGVVTKLSEASPTNVDPLTPVQPAISNQNDSIPPLVTDTSAKTTIVQPHALQTLTRSPSPPFPLVADNSRPLSTPNSFAKPRHPPPQIPALRIVKRSKNIIQQKRSIMTKDAPQQDPIGSRVPVIEASASSLSTITKKGHPLEVPQVRGMDKVLLPPPLALNGPRRMLISEGPKLNPAPNARVGANIQRAKPGPRRVVMAVPRERTLPSGTSLIQPSSRLRQPVKYGTGVVKPVPHTAGSRLPAITR